MEHVFIRAANREIRTHPEKIRKPNRTKQAEKAETGANQETASGTQTQQPQAAPVPNQETGRPRKAPPARPASQTREVRTTRSEAP
jgi:hypothetical protein